MVELKISDHVDDELFQAIRNWIGYSLYHSAEWHNLLEKSFGWKVQYLIWEDSGKTVAILPILEKRRLIKKVTVSLPISHHVEICHLPDTDLKSVWTTLAKSGLKVDVNADCDTNLCSKGMPRYITKIDLSEFEDETALFKSTSKSSIQRKIKRAGIGPFEFRKSNDNNSFVQFEHLQALTRRRQGSPTFPAGYFDNLQQGFKDSSYLFGAYQGDELLAGVLFFFCPDTGVATYMYGANVESEEIVREGLNQKTMWEAISFAYQNKYKVVDFGSSPKGHDNLKQYKEKWGGKSKESSICQFNQGQSQNNAIARDSRFAKFVSSSLTKLPLPVFKQVSGTMIKYLS